MLPRRPRRHLLARLATFVDDQVATRGLVSPEDHSLYRITADVDEAAAEILGFFRNYHSVRWVGRPARHPPAGRPDRGRAGRAERRFADICTEGAIRSTKPLPPSADDDHLELPRVAMRFDRYPLRTAAACSSTP